MRAVIFASALALAGCFPDSGPGLSSAVAAPVPREPWLASRIQMPAGEILVVRAPDALLPEDREFDHRCLIYRDRELSSVTMHCLSEAYTPE